jgi:hypothetical protein
MRICRLQLLLVFASAVILGTESCGTHDHILLSQIRESPNLEDQVPVFISPRNRVTQLYPQVLGSLFVASYDLHGYGVTELSLSYITTDGQSASLVIKHPSGAYDQIFITVRQFRVC